MNQLAMLWEYQQEDRKADKLEQELSRSPIRQKMNTCRTQFNNKQKQYKQIEEQVSMLADRKDAIRDAIGRCEDQLHTLQARFEQNPPATFDDTKALLSEVTRFQQTITSYEQEMKRMTKETAECDQKERSLRIEAVNIKTEFDQLKKQYESEAPQKEAALKEQKSVAEKKAEGISPELLARYQEIKKRIKPPLARLINNQCSGCNMSLPSAVLSRINSANGEIVECESCGRMLIP